MNNAIEEKYVKALSEGDQKAFEVLFLHYHPKLVHFITGFIKNNEQARDMAQDIFLSIWNDKEKLSLVKSFKAYLFKMAKNVICNYYDHIVVDEKFVAEQLARPAEFENSEDIIFARQLQDMIDIAVSQMPPQRKQIYTMSRIDGLSNNEIAEKLNINKRTVENHLTAALSDIRKAIKVCLLFLC
ncbi:MAG: RNA polymerase sigma-70 factor [Prevotellaceae bacterium]|jgi:RNA polymerase sigma-70 factor (ECF subfamily)|nr:RNA polymerase sigma-70 factor [Prevotellaceae bacterium]